jgi:nucleotide-binding universal stress UspA family protein
MRTNILLTVDVAPGDPLRHVSGAVGMVKHLVQASTEQVIVLHVQEFSIPRLARNMADHGGASGRRAVDAVVASLRAAGIHASGVIREADFGHVGRTVLDAADEFNARLIVLGAKSHTGLRRMPASSLATHLMRLSRLPVLIVPPSDELAELRWPQFSRNPSWPAASRSSSRADGCATWPMICAACALASLPQIAAVPCSLTKKLC